MEVGLLSDDALLLAANSTIREDTPFAFSINKKRPRTYSDFLERVRNYINAEALTLKKSRAAKTFLGDPKGDRRKERKRPADNSTRGSYQTRDEK